MAQKGSTKKAPVKIIKAFKEEADDTMKKGMGKAKGKGKGKGKCK